MSRACGVTSWRGENIKRTSHQREGKRERRDGVYPREEITYH